MEISFDGIKYSDITLTNISITSTFDRMTEVVLTFIGSSGGPSFCFDNQRSLIRSWKEICVERESQLFKMNNCFCNNLTFKALPGVNIGEAAQYEMILRVQKVICEDLDDCFID